VLENAPFFSHSFLRWLLAGRFNPSFYFLCGFSFPVPPPKRFINPLVATHLLCSSSIIALQNFHPLGELSPMVSFVVPFFFFSGSFVFLHLCSAPVAPCENLVITFLVFFFHLYPNVSPLSNFIFFAIENHLLRVASFHELPTLWPP